MRCNSCNFFFNAAALTFHNSLLDYLIFFFDYSFPTCISTAVSSKLLLVCINITVEYEMKEYLSTKASTADNSLIGKGNNNNISLLLCVSCLFYNDCNIDQEVI